MQLEKPENQSDRNDMQRHMHTHEGDEAHMHIPQHEGDEAHMHIPQHEGAEAHVHSHQHPNAKAVSNRLARAIGHLEAVKGMVDRGEDCSQVLIQLAAVRAAINNAGKVILMDHLNHCIVDAVEDGDLEKLEEFSKAIQCFVK